MIEQHFGESSPFSLGVEEELMILDAASLDQVAAVERIIGGVAGRALPGQLKTELFASVFETNTNVCASIAEVDAALPELRRAAGESAEGEGLAIAAAGTHPFAKPETQPIVKEERYVTFVGYGGITVRRQGVQGLHVHVGMPSAEESWRCLEGILPWLPVVLALSANSPWFAGELTGMASNRAPVLAELPRAGAPPAFASYGEWEAWVERLTRLGIAQEYTRIWWDVRPHPTARHDRGADRRPAHRRAALDGIRRAPAGDVRDGARRRAARQRRRARRPRARRLRPEPLGGSALRPPRRPDPSRRDERGLGRRSSAASSSTSSRPAAAALGGGKALVRIDPSACESDLQLQGGSALEVAADLVARTLD